MLTLPQRRPVVDDAIMVGSRTCEHAGQEVQVSSARTKTRGESRGSSHGGPANLLCVTQLIHELFHVALNPITVAARVASDRSRGGVSRRALLQDGVQDSRPAAIFRLEELIARSAVVYIRANTTQWPGERRREATTAPLRARYSILNTAAAAAS